MDIPTPLKFYTKHLQITYRDLSEIKFTHWICMNKLKEIKGIEYLQKFTIHQIAK